MKLRKSLDIGYRAPMEMYVEGERIILKRYKPSCAFCGETENTAEFRGKLVCSLCKQELGFRAPEKV
nr:AbrB family transcriptional regulator [Alicyclobacillus tolerans]